MRVEAVTDTRTLIAGARERRARSRKMASASSRSPRNGDFEVFRRRVPERRRPRHPAAFQQYRHRRWPRAPSFAPSACARRKSSSHRELRRLCGPQLRTLERFRPHGLRSAAFHDFDRVDDGCREQRSRPRDARPPCRPGYRKAITSGRAPSCTNTCRRTTRGTASSAFRVLSRVASRRRHTTTRPCSRGSRTCAARSAIVSRCSAFGCDRRDRRVSGDLNRRSRQRPRDERPARDVDELFRAPESHAATGRDDRSAAEFRDAATHALPRV